jgi:hypothetical protein
MDAPSSIPTESCAWCHQNNDPDGVPDAPSTHSPARAARCPQCHREIVFINITGAAKVANVCRKTIYQWIEKGWVTTVKNASGRQLICFTSLFTNTIQEHWTVESADPVE